MLKLIESLIGIEGKYKCNTSSGTYQVEGKLEQDYYGNVTFKGSTTVDACNAISKEEYVDFYGMINETKVTLKNLRFYHSSYELLPESQNCFQVSIILSTDYILTGIENCDNIKVLSITSTVPNCEFKTRSPWFLNYETVGTPDFELKETSNSCCVKTEYGRLSVAQCCIKNLSHFDIPTSCAFKFQCIFDTPKSIATALQYVANVRNLFSFLTGKYLSLSTFDIGITVWNENASKEIPCTLFLNDKYKDRFPDGLPRLIPMSCIFDNFDLIWDRWNGLYEKVPHIVSLFYEIICDNSKRINRFLNLSQALEIYSRYFRDAECRTLKKEENEDKITLRIRIKDILKLLVSKEYLSLSADEASNLSKQLSKMRNYFTHYNSKLGINPTIQEIFAASDVLRFILLTLVFDYFGISEKEAVIGKNDDGTDKKVNVIEAMKKSPQFQYLRTHIDMIANLKDNSSGK